MNLTFTISSTLVMKGSRFNFLLHASHLVIVSALGYMC